MNVTRKRKPSSETSTTLCHQDMSICGSDMSFEYEPPRKKRVRAKLDHLSPGERLQRRKMKNRIAAQTARDRKRAKIDHLEEENRLLREENEKLKSQIMSGSISSCLEVPSNRVASSDSGASDLNSICKSPSLGVAEMEQTITPFIKVCPASPGSSSSGALSASPDTELEHLDSVVDETNESQMIDDILRLQESIFDGYHDASIESAELISVPQQQDQDASSQSPSVENSAGWTSIQLMLLLMISRVHRRYSWKINCCATTPSKLSSQHNCYNLYDYIHQTKCMDFRRAVEAIISNKNNVRKQRLVALEFVYIYLYRGRLDSQHNITSVVRKWPLGK